jgi:sugar phosphate isomerase/epimerase
MKRVIQGVVLMGGLWSALHAAVGPAGDQPARFSAFFVLDNGVGRGKWTPEQQAQTVKELGYDGIGYNYTTPQAAVQWQRELHARGLRLFSLYVYTFIDKPEADRYPRGLQETILRLKGSNAMIWLTLRTSAKPEKTQAECDDACAKVVNQVADWGKASGLKVALYPHAGFYVATAEDALRVVRQVNRPDVGMTINLCHELMQRNSSRLPGIVRQAAPHLFLVTINGADNNGKPNGYIQRLDRGSYDVCGFLSLLTAHGYQGPIGLQCVGIQGDVRDNLEKSMGAWKRYVARLAAPGMP